ncbi:MAG: cytochrome c biogenesis protein ResB [Cyanobacteria bacterium]|nr:cytochrome c biogenesis protein ResB [Cyanobacteriota bacterium]
MAPKFTRFLGSVRLAVPLLAAIAAILIGATFYESQVGSEVVQREIYKSAWFGALMFLLAVNLGISTLSRYPWKGPRKTGFALAHWGLIVIIAGSAAVIHISTEGMLLVRTDSGPNNQIRVAGDLLEVIAPDQTRQQADLFIKADGTVVPHKVGDLALVGYSENAIKTVSFTDDGPVENLAVQVQLRSDRMGQTLERWLAVAPSGYRQMDVGPAHLEIAQAQDKAELTQLLSPPSTDPAPFGILNFGARRLDVQETLGQTQALANGVTVELVNVWPDFRLGSNNQPTSASGQFRNPAVQLNLTQGDAQARWFVFAKSELEPVKTGDEIAIAVQYDAPTVTASDYFRVVAGPDQQLYYAARSSKGFKSGPFQAGESVTPGWADFKISLNQRLDHAQVQRQVVPVTPVASGTLADEGAPALRVVTADGQDFWLPWGEPTTLETSDGDYFAVFSPKLLELPFYVKLDDFIVERNEGSESVAMWTSKVTLFDAKTDTAVRRTVWMNHPTWFRGWKLAQASWNPGDLKQSTLQIKREPWWVTALTWIGSLMVVMGIGTMFYGPGLMKKFRSVSKGKTPDAPDSEPEADAPTDGATPTIPILAVFGK